jgi:YVTN family beta-propeller protein
VDILPRNGTAGLAYKSNNGKIYVTNFDPIEIAYDPNNGIICVANMFSSDIYIIDGSNNNVVASIPFDAHPHGLAYNPANNDTYVANYDSTSHSSMITIKEIDNSPIKVKFKPKNE